MTEKNCNRRTHMLGDLTTAGVTRIDMSSAVAVQPIGAFEQHGPHLPLITDALTAERITSLAIDKLGMQSFAWQLPTLVYGKSTEHLGRPGTVAMSANTLIATCLDVGASLARSGFRKLLFVNGHGGQPGLLEMVARDIRVQHGLEVFCVMPSQFPLPESVTQIDMGYGIHGGQIETSVVWALAPELVDMASAARGGDAMLNLFRADSLLSLEGNISTAWVTDDLSVSGVFGDPTAANLSDGEAIVECQSRHLSELIIEIRDFAFPQMPRGTANE